MDILDPVDRRAAELYASEGGAPEIEGAAEALAASDPHLRDHYRRMALREANRPLVHADAWFRTGGGHDAEGTPCQDYAAAGHYRVPGERDALPFAVISDGCSSSGRTDLGSRLIALSAARLLGPEASKVSFVGDVLDRVRQAAGTLGIVRDDLDATLGVAMAMPGGGARAWLWGDGTVAVRSATGLEVHVVDWVGNMPGYPVYRTDPELMQLFETHSERMAAEAGRAPCLVTRFAVRDGEATVLDVLELGAREGLDGVEVSANLLGLDAVAVTSDGVLQFSASGWPRVVDELTAFRNAREGSFVRRRVNRALGSLAKLGVRPEDDVSVAAIAASAEGAR